MKETLSIDNREAGDLHDIASTDGHGQRLRFEARAMAGWADTGRHIALDLFAYAITLSLFVASIKAGDDPLEMDRIATCVPMLRGVANRQLFGNSVEDLLL